MKSRHRSSLITALVFTACMIMLAGCGRVTYHPGIEDASEKYKADQKTIDRAIKYMNKKYDADFHYYNYLVSDYPELGTYELQLYTDGMDMSNEFDPERAYVYITPSWKGPVYSDTYFMHLRKKEFADEIAKRFAGEFGNAAVVFYPDDSVPTSDLTPESTLEDMLKKDNVMLYANVFVENDEPYTEDEMRSKLNSARKELEKFHSNGLYNVYVVSPSLYEPIANGQYNIDAINDVLRKTNWEPDHVTVHNTASLFTPEDSEDDYNIQ